MSNYNPKLIESKWNDEWYKHNVYEAKDFDPRPKKYILAELPYPSGKALHAGHMMRFTLPDIYSRYLRMNGYNVLFPIGWDAFGLPAESYAIKTGMHPATLIAQTVAGYKDSIRRMGYSIDWNREINTTDPNYYKWTQWIFLQFYKHGLARYQEMPVWWCDELKTVLSDEEVLTDKDGNKISERGNYPVTRRDLNQWVLDIKAYADKLLEGLQEVDYPESIKLAQTNWIGKSTGATINFDVEGHELTVFTTRPDTIYGVTFLALAPEHPLISKIKDKIHNWNEVEQFIQECKRQTDINKYATKEKKGIKLEGVYVTNPIDTTQKLIPVYIADYVLIDYGLGAIMGVPAHDDRDFEFAKKYDIPIKYVIKNDSDVVIGIHGWASVYDKSFLGGLAEYLKNAGIDFVNDQLPAPNYDTWYKLIAAKIEAAQENNKNVILVGHSAGGYLALKLAENYKLKQLVVVSPCEPVSAYSEERYKITQDWLQGDEYQNYLNFHSAQIDETKIKQNVSDITFVFGLKDKYILEPAREYYQSKFSDFSKFVLLAHRGHMGSSEDTYDIKEVNEILDNCDALEGTAINSGEYTGLNTSQFFEKITDHLKKVGLGGKTTTYKLHDWVFSRQRYWGEPIPLIHKKDGTIEPICNVDDPVSVETNLPLTLPEVPDYNPTSDGLSPLEKNAEWVKVKATDGTEAKRETNTMPNWAGSCWYYIRYIDPKNNAAFADFEKLKYWLPVDRYFGGAEHTTLHLLYSRFWHRFLYDIGKVPTKEPYAWRMNGGLLLGADGRKMSKSLGNTVEPIELVEEFGADSLRMYIPFLGPYDETYPWSANGIKATNKLLRTIYSLQGKVSADAQADEETTRKFHKLVKNVTDMIENLKMNTAISEFMIFVNHAKNLSTIPQDMWQEFIKLLAPFAPFLAEELWQTFHNNNTFETSKSVHLQNWPKFNDELALEKVSQIPVQINGKVRCQIPVADNDTEDTIKEKLLQVTKLKPYLQDKPIKKLIYVPGKIVNVVN